MYVPIGANLLGQLNGNLPTYTLMENYLASWVETYLVPTYQHTGRNLPGQLSGELLILLLPHCSFTTEQINLGARWQQSLVLLPLQSLNILFYLVEFIHKYLSEQGK